MNREANKQEVSPNGAGLAFQVEVAKTRPRRRWIFATLAILASALLTGPSEAQTSAPVNLQAPLAFNGSVGTVPNAVAMGDFNGDGLQFFAVVETNPSNPIAGQIEIFFGTKMGSFISKGVIPNIGIIGGQQFFATHPIAVGHFNGASQPLGIAVAVNSSLLPGCAQGGVVVLFGNADQTFQPAVCLPDSPGVNGVVVGDFHGTGFDDIAAANASGAGTSFTVFQSSGASSFPSSAKFTAVAPGTSTVLNGVLYVGGYGNTNLPNLVLLASTGPFTQFVAALQTSHGSGSSALAFMNSGVLATGSNGFTDIGFADMNGDGVVDIVGISEVTNLQYFPVTIANGVNVIHALTGIGGPDGFALSIGDFNGNGIGDFASLNESRNLSITFDVPCFNTLNPLCASIKPSTIGPFGPVGQGIASGFSPGAAFTGSSSPGEWVVVDAGVFQVTSSSFEEIPEARSIAVYLLDPITRQPTIAPLFSQSSTTTTGTPPPAFAVRDLDGDGAPDVAVLGENQATFAATVTPFKNVPGTPGFVAQSVFDLGAGEGGSEPGLNPFAIAAGKFRNATNNPSGLPDLALVLPDGITVLNNGGEFKFTADAKCQGVSTSPATNCYLGNDPNFPGFPFSSPPRPAVIAADVNGDGIDDIVLAIPENCNSFDSGGAKARIYVLLSNGDGSFRPAVSYPSPVVNPVALALGNILGPGAPDLVVTNGGEVCTGSEAATGPILNMGAALLPNLRDGSAFGSPATLAAQPVFPQTSDVLFPQISAVAVADMNADGTADVVISASDGIHVLLNKKTNPATFKDMGPVPLYGPGDTIENAAQIDIADFNGDRTPDVAAAIGGIVYVFTNDGTGFLTSPSQGFASGPNSGQVKAIDVNGDQVPDVLVSNSQGFSELLNNAGVETPLAQFSALNLSYGGMALGTPSLMLLTLGNTGGAPLIISSFDYTKNTAGQFTTKQVQCGSTLNPTSPITIAIGGNCTFEIIFTPSVLGTTSAQIVFDDNASSTNAPQTSVGRLFQQTIELTGAGVVSTANVSIAVSNSPTVVTVGTPILEYTITLTNTGPSPATNLTFTHKLESSVLNQGVVSSQGNCTGTRASGVTITCSLGTLPANSSATIVLDVTPNAAGVLRNPFSFLQDEQDADVESTLDNVSVLASLNASVPAISEPITVNDQVTITQLINVAAPVVFFSPSSVGFGTVASDATAARVVTVSNIGVGSTGLALTKAAMSSSAFTLGPITCSNGASSLPTTLPSGGACTVTITLSGPAPSGATITFTDNAALSNVTSTASGSSFTQSIPLIGSSMSITLPPPPSTVAIPTIDEPIMVNDTVAIKVTSPPSSTVTIGSKLGSIILDPTAGVQQYIATVALSNGGNIAGNIQVISATLNGVSSTSVPISLTLGSADSASITLNFPSSAGTSGTLVVLSIKGTYSASEPGGISLNGSWTGEFRVTLPASTQ